MNIECDKSKLCEISRENCGRSFGDACLLIPSVSGTTHSGERLRPASAACLPGDIMKCLRKDKCAKCLSLSPTACLLIPSVMVDSSGGSSRVLTVTHLVLTVCLLGVLNPQDSPRADCFVSASRGGYINRDYASDCLNRATCPKHLK